MDFHCDHACQGVEPCLMKCFVQSLSEDWNFRMRPSPTLWRRRHAIAWATMNVGPQVTPREKINVERV